MKSKVTSLSLRNLCLRNPSADERKDVLHVHQNRIMHFHPISTWTSYFKKTNRYYQSFFSSTFLLPLNSSKTQSWIEFLNSILSSSVFKKHELLMLTKIWNFKANYLLPKPIIYVYKFFSTLLYIPINGVTIIVYIHILIL